MRMIICRKCNKEGHNCFCEDKDERLYECFNKWGKRIFGKHFELSREFVGLKNKGD